MTAVLVTGASSGFGALTAHALKDAGHMVTGPAEAFTPARYASPYDTNVLGAQRVNRRLLPEMRSRGDGLADLPHPAV
jgi:NADP-dependent 3-hydroxy acid dehydrogenase YdfG